MSDYEFLQAAPPGPSFERSWPVRTGDVDPERRVRLDGIARYLQDMANDEMFHRGFDATDPYWLVRRSIIDVLEPLQWPSEVTLLRWCESTSSRWCNMRITLRGSAGGHVETEAFWIRFSADSGMPTHISDGGMEYLQQHVTETRLRWKALNTAAPPEPSEGDYTVKLRATDFDPYQHLNNASYLQLVEDDLNGDALLAAPHRAIIEYLAPIPLGSSVQVRSERDDTGYRQWLFLLDEDGAPARKPASTVSVVALPGAPFDPPAPWPPEQVERIEWRV
ncbi:acyl-[acyl-carrier-protein] thioesterase [Tsukamurella ocularis]|uniref:acyl-[acyl-carrier-protein] thioesterase n=1 Tax=Tsukamurella ocularis TaxID=1970234 RepID=UPI002168F581|nr:acyl-ACP thioesterase domain-containing protein [Tsukamurella ocularis]MCS3778563.1 acyl-ACP thioesterase [Tsukamurella ocularis]MCS3789264.1 acyl-ACP thioesterase [Tsukamurella ocularis]MCS3853114.1 acyl-ACP thioesterase [Tsukamurella ocularis]